MPEILDTAADSLSDYTKQFKIASFYTNGDADRAKQMIAGTLKDCYVIKGAFYSATTMGAFIIFFNYDFLALNSVYPVIANSSTLKDLKTNTSWKVFEKELVDFANTQEHDAVLNRQFKNFFSAAFTFKFAGELKALIQAKDEIGVNRFFMQFAQDRIGFFGVTMRIDGEFISSLEMELYSLTSKKIIEHKNANKDQVAADEPHIELEADDDKEFYKERDVRFILRGGLVLSPVTGRDVGLLIVGDRIKVKLMDSQPKAIQVAKAFNAYDDDGIHPITGRIVSLRHLADGGYKIFVIVAKGIYVKIEETEENIKIALDTSYLDDQQSMDKVSKVSIVIMAILSAILLGLIGLMIFFFKK